MGRSQPEGVCGGAMDKKDKKRRLTTEDAETMLRAVHTHTVRPAMDGTWAELFSFNTTMPALVDSVSIEHTWLQNVVRDAPCHDELPAGTVQVPIQILLTRHTWHKGWATLLTSLHRFAPMFHSFRTKPKLQVLRTGMFACDFIIYCLKRESKEGLLQAARFIALKLDSYWADVFRGFVCETPYAFRTNFTFKARISIDTTDIITDTIEINMLRQLTSIHPPMRIPPRFLPNYIQPDFAKKELIISLPCMKV
jgi:hypothetical protein